MAKRHSTILTLALVTLLLLSACTAAAPGTEQGASAPDRQIDATALAALRERAQAEGQVPLIAGFAVAGLEAPLRCSVSGGYIPRPRIPHPPTSQV